MMLWGKNLLIYGCNFVLFLFIQGIINQIIPWYIYWPSHGSYQVVFYVYYIFDTNNNIENLFIYMRLSYLVHTSPFHLLKTDHGLLLHLIKGFYLHFWIMFFHDNPKYWVIHKSMMVITGIRQHIIFQVEIFDTKSLSLKGMKNNHRY